MIEQIWTEFHQQLLRFIITKVRDTSIAEDILQEVFIQVISKIDNLKDQAKLSPWLYQICRNKIIDYYRNNKLDTVSIDLYDTPDTKLTHEEASGLDRCIRILISDLPTNVSSILLKSELENIKQKDIAKNRNISLPALKSRLRRGRFLLKKKLLACCTIKFTENGVDATCKNKCGCNN